MVNNDGVNPDPTLAGVYSHLTRHIQDNQGTYVPMLQNIMKFYENPRTQTIKIGSTYGDKGFTVIGQEIPTLKIAVKQEVTVSLVAWTT